MTSNFDSLWSLLTVHHRAHCGVDLYLAEHSAECFPLCAWYHWVDSFALPMPIKALPLVSRVRPWVVLVIDIMCIYIYIYTQYTVYISIYIYNIYIIIYNLLVCPSSFGVGVLSLRSCRWRLHFFESWKQSHQRSQNTPTCLKQPRPKNIDFQMLRKEKMDLPTILWYFDISMGHSHVQKVIHLYRFRWKRWAKPQSLWSFGVPGVAVDPQLDNQMLQRARSITISDSGP